MTNSLELKLRGNFPKLLRDMYGSPKETCMAWGISCDDGWYDLIYNLCSELQCWSDAYGKQIVATQIKEKFGGLRFYISIDGDVSDDGWSQVNTIISKYEDISLDTCELTGGFGEMCKRGFLMKTLCKESAILCGFKPLK
jgi:hypothetical protein